MPALQAKTFYTDPISISDVLRLSRDQQRSRDFIRSVFLLGD